MNIVQQIHDNLISMAQSELGASWVRMRRVFDPSQNDFRTAKNCFGVVHGSADNSDGVTNHYTLDHSFELLLMSNIVDRTNDIAIQTVINSLYDKADELFKKFFITKIGLPTIVLVVNEPAIAQPELFDNSVLLRLSLNVKYRNQVD